MPKLTIRLPAIHPPSTRGGLDVWVPRICLALVVLPLLWATSHWLSHTTYSFGDRAVIETRTFDVGTTNTPLLGQVTYGGFNQPGPLLYWVLAVPYRLLFGTSIFAAASLLNAAAAASLFVVARRRGGTSLALLSAIGALLLVRTMSGTIGDPWNPYVPILWFPTFLLLIWSLTEGRIASFAPALFIGSFLIQCHVQYAFEVVGLFLWALPWFVIAVRRDLRADDPVTRTATRRDLRRGMTWTAMAFVVAWGAPIWEQLNGKPGNVIQILDYLAAAKDPLAFTKWRALEIFAAQVAPKPTWIAPEMLLLPQFERVWWMLPFGALTAFAVWRARQRGDRRVLLLLGSVLVANAAGWLTLANLRGPVWGYYSRFTWPTAMITWVALAWALWRAVDEPIRVRVRTPAMVAATAALAVGSVVVTNTATDGLVPNADDTIIAATIDDIVTNLPTDGPVSMRSSGGAFFLFQSYIPALERRGIPVAIGAPEVWGLVRKHRVPTGTVIVVVGPAVDRFPERPTQVLLAQFESSYAASEREIVARLGELLRVLGEPQLAEIPIQGDIQQLFPLAAERSAALPEGSVEKVRWDQVHSTTNELYLLREDAVHHGTLGMAAVWFEPAPS